MESQTSTDVCPKYMYVDIDCIDLRYKPATSCYLQLSKLQANVRRKTTIHVYGLGLLAPSQNSINQVKCFISILVNQNYDYIYQVVWYDTEINF